MTAARADLCPILSILILAHAGHEIWPWNEASPRVRNARNAQSAVTKTPTASSNFPTSCSYRVHISAAIISEPFLVVLHPIQSAVYTEYTLSVACPRRSRRLSDRPRAWPLLSPRLSELTRTSSSFPFPFSGPRSRLLSHHPLAFSTAGQSSDIPYRCSFSSGFSFLGFLF